MKGGLISLAAATVGLTTEAAQHLEVRGCLSLVIFVMDLIELFPLIKYLNYANFIYG